MNRTIMEKVCFRLSTPKLRKSFWVKAIAASCFLINRSPSVAINKKTPIEVWSGTPTFYYDLKIFGCRAYACINNGKLEPRSIKYFFFLSYKNGVKWYKLWCPKTHKTMVNKDVIFYETVMLRDLHTNDSCETSQ